MNGQTSGGKQLPEAVYLQQMRGTGSLQIVYLKIQTEVVSVEYWLYQARQVQHLMQPLLDVGLLARNIQ